MQKLSERTAHFTDSVIRRMTRVSNQYGAVNLSQGFPDFAPPRVLLDRMAQVAYEENYHQYSITWGAQDFREALAAKQSRFMGLSIDPNGEIVVTCGSTEAMMAAMMTVTNPSDKVVIFSPFYENYSADTIPRAPTMSCSMFLNSATQATSRSARIWHGSSAWERSPARASSVSRSTTSSVCTLPRRMKRCSKRSTGWRACEPSSRRGESRARKHRGHKDTLKIDPQEGKSHFVK